MLEKAKLIIEVIINNHEKIIEILLNYESYQVAEYEIERVLDTLTNIEVNLKYLEDKIDNISVCMPSNLPFYSLILFGIIPSFQSQGKIFIKPRNERKIHY